MEERIIKDINNLLTQLFQKMHEAGYEWNAKKKELKKIHVIDEGKAEMDYCFTKMMNGEKVSSAWSEEDELHLKDAIHAAYSPDCGGDELIDWLKSLKERVKSQWKPSEEQMKQLKSAADIYPDSRLGYALRSLHQDLMTYWSNLKL